MDGTKKKTSRRPVCALNQDGDGILRLAVSVRTSTDRPRKGMEAAGGEAASARGAGGSGRWAVGAVCGGLVYYHCAVRRASAVSLAADVLLVLLCSLSILGLLFRHLHIS